MRPLPDAAMVDDIAVRFTYHPPTAEQAARMSDLRDDCRALALKVLARTPASREQALAITHLEEVSMWANAAIARREEDPSLPAQ